MDASISDFFTLPFQDELNRKLHNQLVKYSYHKNEFSKVIDLIRTGADVNLSDMNVGETALSIAIRHNDINALEALLSIPGIDVNRADNNGRSPLIAAAILGDEDVINKLLATPGILVNQPNQAGETALMLAAYLGHTKIIEALLGAPGIQVNGAS